MTMKRTLLGSSFLATLLVAGAFWAGSPPAIANANVNAATQDVGVGGNVRLLRLGVPQEGRLGDLLRKNAKISAGFEVIPRASMGQLARAKDFQADKWSSLGADAVVLSSSVGSQVKFKLYELAKGSKPVLTKGYSAKDELAAANKFMNEVMKYYTGELGPFGSRIGFVRTRRNPTVSKNIQTVQMNGESPSGITSNRSLNILPSLNPGGGVLFTSYAKRNPDLWMSSGGSPTRVSKYPGLNLGGTMSPDGSSIALALSKDGNSEIYKLGRDGSVRGRLTKHGAIDGSPTWSPAGQIAFVSSRAGGPQIFRMSASGGGATRVTKKGSYNQSPDWNQGKGRGQWVVYSGRDSSNRYDIFKVDVKTGKVKRITQQAGRNLDPSWSPDGRFVAYSRNGGIYVATEEGLNNVQIAKGASTPDWGPRAY
jgi:TolB protein